MKIGSPCQSLSLKGKGADPTAEDKPQYSPYGKSPNLSNKPFFFKFIPL
jgi:hypothetical protein